ncbi:hypothetical protein [Bartonella tamiae]|uniref:Uncharacterized protein n=1 Tax=Bartonella tamiae Th239 TaxID=1094558 RepID=J0R3R7_9HYPH|nr:hypothetical protein [Bartonella tamiae]EJF90274.1 hypothetical protein ME5_00675 [Bartonella tamiae Th239]EJF93785.1 hypothetical protein MEG_01209 [Bartonella tamiae Th307]
MFRGIAKFVSVLFLLALLTIAIIDSARSIGQSDIILTPFYTLLESIVQFELNNIKDGVEMTFSSYLSYSVVFFIKLPAVVILGLLSLLFFVIGYKQNQSLSESSDLRKI